MKTNTRHYLDLHGLPQVQFSTRTHMGWIVTQGAASEQSTLFRCHRGLLHAAGI